jgi:hypothetical protein
MRMRAAALGIFLSFFALMNTTSAQDDATLEIGGSQIDVTFFRSPSPQFRHALLDWIENAARAVVNYYQRFPADHVRLRIDSFDGRGVRDGHTFGDKIPRISIAVGNASTASDFADDWMLTHEMIHLAFPSVPERHHWIEEGLATYVEPVARARVGQLSVEKVWSDWVHDMPKGLPENGDRGLDFTPTWGRTYWGGALFCLLADIEIRKRTGNRKGLEHALRAIVKEGGTIESEWPLSRALEVGDRATGLPVLGELYEKMSGSPTPIDLQALWKELGVERHGSKIEFNDASPLAPIRKAITALSALASRSD